MPLILVNPNVAGSTRTTLGRPRFLTADGTVSRQFRAQLSRDRDLTATSGVVVAGVASVARARNLNAFGRVGSESNVFGVVALDRVRDLDADSTFRIGAVFVGDRGRELEASARQQSQETSTLNILVQITGSDDPGKAKAYSARIYADEVAYKIKAFSFQETRSDVGLSLEVTLVNPGDRAAIEAALEFEFQIYDGTGWVTMFGAGKRTGTGRNITFADGRPDDSLTISTNGDVDAKFRKSPFRNTTVYDPNRIPLTLADFDVIYATDGTAFFQNLVPYGGLDLYTLLQYAFVAGCGFSSVETTLPNFPVRRADFSMAGTWFDGVAAAIGPFQPFIFVVDNVVWVLDSTAPFPAGFGSPDQLEAKDYLNAQFSEQVLDVDAYIVQFSDQETDYDYTSNRDVDEDPDINGTYGTPSYTEVTRSKTFRDYYKFSNPFVPVRTEKTKDETITKGFVNGALVTIATEIERLNYDSFARITSISKEHTALIPDLADPEFTPFEATVRSEYTRFMYGPDRLRPRRQILRKTVKEITGLVTIDTENPHLEQPFRQEYSDGFSAGNLKAGLDLVLAPIETTTEIIDQNDKGQFEVRTKRVNYLTDPPQILNSTTDARSGDASLNSSTGAGNQIIVFRPLTTRSDPKMETLAVGEVPINVGIALAYRKLEKTVNRRGTITLKGLRLSIGRGTMFEVLDRDGFSLGVFVCEGRTIAGNNLGTGSQATRQVLEVVQI